MTTTTPDDGMTVTDRMERLTRHGLTKAALVALFVTFFFANYDISVFALVLPAVSDQYGFSTLQQALPVAINLAGYAVGAYAIGVLADHFGRRAGLFTTAAVLAVSGALTAASWGPWSFAIFRGLCGLGTGAMLALGTSYLAELMPAGRRGMAMNTIMFGVSTLGLAAGLASPPLVTSLPGVGWRIITAFAVLAVVVVPIVLSKRLFSESPRWLARRGRLDEATRVLAAIEERAWSRGSPRPAVTTLSRVAPDVEEARSSTRALFADRELRRRLAIITGFWLLLYFSDYVFLSYSSIIYKELGASPSGALWLTAATRAGQVIVALVFFLAIERFERKWLTVAGTLLLAVGYGFLLIPSTVTFSIGGLVATFGIGMIAIAGWTYTAEIFPSHSRATGAAFGDGAGHFGGAIQPFVFLPLIGLIGIRGALGLVIVTSVLAALVLSLGPKTLARDLSSIGAA